MNYLSIKEATILMALENGCVNRYNSLEDMIDRLKEFVAGEDEDILAEANEFLCGLTTTQKEQFVAGTEEEMTALGASANVDDLMDRIYSEVL